MAKQVKNEDTEACLRELLNEQGYKLNQERTWGETGVDILAKKGAEEWHIEVIGYKSTGPARAKDFFAAFFRAVSRLNDDAKHCVITMPIQAHIGLPARAKQYRVAWKRIAQAFSELEIWLVDIENRTYKKTTWIEWLR